MEFNKKNVKSILLLATAIIVIYHIFDNVNNILAFLGTCFSIIFPFLLGLGIAFIINVPMRFYERQLKKLCKPGSLLDKNKRLLSFLLTLVMLFGILCLVSFLVIPQITVTISQVIDQIPQFTKTVSKWLGTLQKKIPQLEVTIGNFEEGWDVLGKALQKVDTSQITGMFSSTVGIISGVISGVVSFFIAFVFSCYVVFQKETLSEQCKKAVYALLPVRTADRTIDLFRMADKTFSGFLVGQCTEALILGMLFIVTLSILGMPYSVMIGVLIGVMSLIPIVGAFIACFVGAFLILMVDPMQAVLFVIIFLLLQQIEGNFIYPHVVGNSVGLPSIWVLAAVTVGGNLMGVAGMIIGIPVVSILYALFARYVHVKLMAKHVSDYKWKNRPSVPEKVRKKRQKSKGDGVRPDTKEDGK